MDRNLLSRVDEWIAAHRSEMIHDLQELVRIPSVSVPDENCPPFGPHCRAVLEHMFELGARHGYEHKNFDNYVGEIIFTEGDQKVGMWAHLDVVPVPDPSEWDYPPFECTLVEDRYLIGRGVQDNKMPAMACFHVMNCLKDLGVKLCHGYSLYMGTNEEVGMADVKYYVSKYPCPDLSLVPDAGFPVCVGQRGSMGVTLSIPFAPELEVQQGNGPSVTPENITVRLADGRELYAEGFCNHFYLTGGKPNAVLLMLEKLAECYPEEADKLLALKKLCASFDGSALGIAYSDDDSALCIAPTLMYTENGRLVVRAFSALPLTVDTDHLLPKAQTAAAAYGVTAEIPRIRKPCHFPRNHPLVDKLAGVYHEVTGYSAEPYVMNGGNYAAYLPNALGFGPGMPGREFPEHIFRPGRGDYHQCDESEDVEHMIAFMRIYAMAILALEELDVTRQEG